jgi:hypothetical protein
VSEVSALRQNAGVTIGSDVAGVLPGSEVEGIISTEQSVSAMLQVISTKTLKDSGTFWTWEGKVNQCRFNFRRR